VPSPSRMTCPKGNHISQGGIRILAFQRGSWIRLGFRSGLGCGADPFADPPLTDAICEAQVIREGEDTKAQDCALRWHVMGFSSLIAESLIL
jgi:hypothetical protein